MHVFKCSGLAAILNTKFQPISRRILKHKKRLAFLSNSGTTCSLHCCMFLWQRFFIEACCHYDELT